MKTQELINKLQKIETLSYEDRHLINLACKKITDLGNKLNQIILNKQTYE